MRKKKFIHIYYVIEDLKKFLVSKEFMNSKEGYNLFDNDPIPEYKNHDFDKPFLTLTVDEIKFTFENTYLLHTIANHFTNKDTKIILTVDGAKEKNIVPTAVLEDLADVSEDDILPKKKEEMSVYTVAAGMHDFMASNFKKNTKYLIEFYDLKPSEYDLDWLCDMLFNFKHFPEKFIKERWKGKNFYA